jgi:hypothetical protein
MLLSCISVEQFLNVARDLARFIKYVLRVNIQYSSQEPVKHGKSQTE